MVEIRFKPSDVGTVADGSITDAKITSGGLSQSVITDLPTDLGTKISGIGTSGDKAITKIGWDSATEEVVVDHEA